MDDKSVATDGTDGPSTSRQSGTNGSADNKSSKIIQVGKAYGPIAKQCVPVAKKKVDPSDLEGCEEPVVLNFEKGCASHSFCIVESLKRKGIYPIQPKGLPWASGKLLYLPGQRPKHYDKTEEELAAIEKRKIKKKKRDQDKLKKEEKRVMNKLRHGDHVKLCDVMNTTQELVVLMKVITMVMQSKQAERRKIRAGMQTDEESVLEEWEDDTGPPPDIKVPEEMEEEMEAIPEEPE